MKTYYLLTKPGIIFGNLITTVAGFLLASQGSINFTLFVTTLLGLSLIIASACVFNNCIDRKIDEKMVRTKNRALVTGKITLFHALLFAFGLGVAGSFILFCFTTQLALVVAMAGFFIYVIIYGIWKQRTVHGTLIGSIAGAVPPIVGYTAVSNTIDGGACLLFVILVLWQMPHFYAIAMYRFDDYAAASIPVLPVTKGMQHTKLQICLYVIAFTVMTLFLSLCGYTGGIYLLVAATLGVVWIYVALQGLTLQGPTLHGLQVQNDTKFDQMKCDQAKYDQMWARKMFIYSLVVIMALSITISIDVIPGGKISPLTIKRERERV